MRFGIKRPPNPHYRDYCFECRHWWRDKYREYECCRIYGTDAKHEVSGRCMYFDGILRNEYRQACWMFERG